MQNTHFLKGHTSFETAYVVSHYPYGNRRTEKYYWVETNAKHGDRLVTVTINPKTGNFNKPKLGIYSTFVYLFLNENSHVKHDILDFNGLPELIRQRFTEFFAQYDQASLSDFQRANVQSENLLIDAATKIQRMEGITREHFKNWAIKTATFIRNGPFDQIAGYPDYVPLADTSSSLPSEQAA